ncbi:DedA family protein [Dermatophilus congolensis]|uniref:DedA family protein n=1 Tax=Dermatophilus congolensis TaxID=1863 RepID=UPI001FB89D7E|nr:hypothetical protein [Dermatophilus congolensis]
MRVRFRYEGNSGWAAALCGISLSVVAVYQVVSLLARPVLLALSPAVLAMLTGSRTALVALGVLAAGRGEPWLLALVVSIASIMKFHWVYWWAGALWGEKVMIALAGGSLRAAKRVEQAEAVVRRYRVLAVALAYVPLPLPRELIYALLGQSRVRLWIFLVVDVVAAVVTQVSFFAAGVALGEAALPLITFYAKWVGVFAVAVMALAGLRWWWGRSDKKVV